MYPVKDKNGWWRIVLPDNTLDFGVFETEEEAQRRLEKLELDWNDEDDHEDSSSFEDFYNYEY